MKKFVFPILTIAFLCLALGSCGATEAAEKTVDTFYEILKSKNYDNIEALIDQEALTIDPIETWQQILVNKESMGDLESYSKDTGFNTSINNGITTVKIDYTCEYTNGPIYEKFTLVDRGEGFKIRMYEYNVDKSALSAD